jgi:hypothetical protein
MAQFHPAEYNIGKTLNVSAFDAPAMAQRQAALLSRMNELDLRWMRPRREAS